MAWIIAIVLLIFYSLGVFVFHGTKAIHLLQFLALAILFADYLLARRYRKD